MQHVECYKVYIMQHVKIVTILVCAILSIAGWLSGRFGIHFVLWFIQLHGLYRT